MAYDRRNGEDVLALDQVGWRVKTKMKRTLLSLVAAVLSYGSSSAQTIMGTGVDSTSHPRVNRVLEYGQDHPTPAFIRANIAAMERTPFDGFAFHLLSETDNAELWSYIWGSRQFETDEFRQALIDINSVQFTRLTDRFLMVSVVPGTADWFSDTAFAVIVHNFTVAALFAKQSGSKGFMFDTEDYGSGIYTYAFQNAIHPATLAAFKTKVRQRGQEWMNAVQGRFPSITILLTVGYWGTPDMQYELMAAFLDGILDVAGPQCMIIDGYELSYGQRIRSQFQSAYQAIKVGSVAALSGSPVKYGQIMKAGFGLWLDAQYSTLGWNQVDFSTNYWTPAQFEAAVRNAWDYSDRYVWIWSETVNWYTGLNIPAEYIAAVSLGTVRDPSP